MNKIRKRKAVRSALCRPRCRDYSCDLPLRKTKLPKRSCEHGAPLLFARPFEEKDISCAPLDGRVESFRPICAHNDNGGQTTVAQATNPSDEGIHAGTIFVMHLGKLPRLPDSVSFINEENHSAACPTRSRLQAPRFFKNIVKSSRKELRHLPDVTSPTSGKTQRKKSNVDFLRSCDSVSDRLGELCLSRAHITSEYDERRPP